MQAAAPSRSLKNPGLQALHLSVGSVAPRNLPAAQGVQLFPSPPSLPPVLPASHLKQVAAPVLLWVDWPNAHASQFEELDARA